MDTKSVYQNSKYDVLEGDNHSLFLHQPNPLYVTLVVLDTDQVILVKQYRTAVQRATYELPGGHVKQGEALEAAARRELLEETGLICGELVWLGEICNYACMMNRVSHLYFTKEIVSRQEQHLDEDEDIEIQRYAVDEVFARIADGRFNDPEMAHGLLLARLKGLL